MRIRYQRRQRVAPCLLADPCYTSMAILLKSSEIQPSGWAHQPQSVEIGDLIYVAKDATGFPSEQLERVRIFLLRHDTGTGAGMLIRTSPRYQHAHVYTHLYASLNVTNPNSAVE